MSSIIINREADFQRCPDEKAFWEMQQIYKRTPLLKSYFNIKLQCNFIEVKHQDCCSLVAKFDTFFQETFL